MGAIGEILLHRCTSAYGRESTWRTDRGRERETGEGGRGGREGELPRMNAAAAAKTEKEEEGWIMQEG